MKDRAEHVGIALGNCGFVHVNGMVRIDSLNPADADYNRKIAKNFLAVGTFFDASYDIPRNVTPELSIQRRSEACCL